LTKQRAPVCVRRVQTGM